MKTVQQLNQERETAQTELFKQVRLFWAFSNQQLEEGKKQINYQEGEKLVHIGGGGYIPKSNVDTFLNGLETINKAYKEGVKQNKLRPKLIAYQLANHECYYTGDIQPALMALGNDFTEEEVRQVYRKEFKKWAESNA
jgi:hypothetical protein